MGLWSAPTVTTTCAPDASTRVPSPIGKTESAVSSISLATSLACGLGPCDVLDARRRARLIRRVLDGAEPEATVLDVVGDSTREARDRRPVQDRDGRARAIDRRTTRSAGGRRLDGRLGDRVLLRRRVGPAADNARDDQPEDQQDTDADRYRQEGAHARAPATSVTAGRFPAPGGSVDDIRARPGRRARRCRARLVGAQRASRRRRDDRRLSALPRDRRRRRRCPLRSVRGVRRCRADLGRLVGTSCRRGGRDGRRRRGPGVTGAPGLAAWAAGVNGAPGVEGAPGAAGRAIGCGTTRCWTAGT